MSSNCSRLLASVVDMSDADMSVDDNSATDSVFRKFQTGSESWVPWREQQQLGKFAAGGRRSERIPIAF